MSIVRPFFAGTTKKLILFLAGALSIFLLFLVPPYKKWWKERIVSYWNDFLVQRNHQDIEYRKNKRFLSHYTYSKQVAGFFEKKGTKKNAIVLMPSTSYFKRNGINYEVPEPGVFYLFTDLKTVLISSPNAAAANWYVRVCDKKIIIDSIIDINLLKDTIRLYSCIGKTGTSL